MNTKIKFIILGVIAIAVTVFALFTMPMSQEDQEKLIEEVNAEVRENFWLSRSKYKEYYSARFSDWYSSEAILDAIEYGTNDPNLECIVQMIQVDDEYESMGGYKAIVDGACVSLTKAQSGVWHLLWYCNGSVLEKNHIEATNRNVFLISVYLTGSTVNWSLDNIAEEITDNEEKYLKDIPTDTSIFPHPDNIITHNIRPEQKSVSKNEGKEPFQSTTIKEKIADYIKKSGGNNASKNTGTYDRTGKTTSKRLFVEDNDRMVMLYIEKLSSTDNVVFCDERFRIFNCRCVPTSGYNTSDSYDYDLSGSLEILSDKAYESIVLGFTLTDKKDKPLELNAGVVSVKGTEKIMIPGSIYDFKCRIYAHWTAEYNAKGFALDGISALECDIPKDVIDSFREEENKKKNPVDGTNNSGEKTDNKTDSDKDKELKKSKMILPESSYRYLFSEEILQFSKEELRIARNEIYARHGRKFSSRDLQEYFESCDWYVPIYEAEEFDESILSEVEKENIKTIKEIEDSLV